MVQKVACKAACQGQDVLERHLHLVTACRGQQQMRRCLAVPSFHKPMVELFVHPNCCAVATNLLEQLHVISWLVVGCLTLRIRSTGHVEKDAQSSGDIVISQGGLSNKLHLGRKAINGRAEHGWSPCWAHRTAGSPLPPSM
jgi:hypothetical protein